MMQRKSLTELAREAPAPEKPATGGGEKVVRLNLEVPVSVRKALQKAAIDEGVTMRELGTRVLREYLERMNR